MDVALNNNYIDNLLKELETHLEEPTDILLVGGAVMSIKQLRLVTYDIDAVDFTNGCKGKILKAAKEVTLSKENPHWLNYDVENLPVRLSKLNKKLYKRIGNLSVYIVDDLDLLVMKIRCYSDRGSIKDLEDVSSIVVTSEPFTYEEVESRLKEICPTFSDFDLAKSCLETAKYFLPEDFVMNK